MLIVIFIICANFNELYNQLSGFSPSLFLVLSCQSIIAKMQLQQEQQSILISHLIVF